MRLLGLLYPLVIPTVSDRALFARLFMISVSGAEKSYMSVM